MSCPARRSSSLLLIVASLALAGALSAIGCAQKEGERCERDQDCEGDLQCDKEMCRPRGWSPTVDSGAAVDLPVAEAAAEIPAVDAPAEVPADTGPESVVEVNVDAPDAGGDVPRLDQSSDITAG
jgi:hypothetical protein